MFFKDIIFKGFSFTVLERKSVHVAFSPPHMDRVFAKLLLMRKIGIVFLFEWTCHFLSEG